jgi:hypothetical protein
VYLDFPNRLIHYKAYGHGRIFLKEFVGFEVVTPVVIKISVFWVITPCSPLKFNRRYFRQPPAFTLGTRGSVVWLKPCVTRLKVVGSIPDEIIGF